MTFSATHKGVLPLNPTEAQLVAAYGAMEAHLIRSAPTPPPLRWHAGRELKSGGGGDGGGGSSFGDVNYIGYANLRFLREGTNGPLRVVDRRCKLVIQVRTATRSHDMPTDTCQMHSGADRNREGGMSSYPNAHEAGVKTVP